MALRLQRGVCLSTLLKMPYKMKIEVVGGARRLAAEGMLEWCSG
jgi:hypothetical protein